jgi:hypothetical protein
MYFIWFYSRAMWPLHVFPQILQKVPLKCPEWPKRNSSTYFFSEITKHKEALSVYFCFLSVRFYFTFIMSFKSVGNLLNCLLLFFKWKLLYNFSFCNSVWLFWKITHAWNFDGRKKNKNNVVHMFLPFALTLESYTDLLRFFSSVYREQWSLNIFS